MQCVALSGPIHMLEVFILPCGANGMKPGLQVTLSDSIHQTLLNGTFYQTTSSPLSGGVTSTLNINIVKKSNGVTFGVSGNIILCSLTATVIARYYVPFRAKIT